MDLALLNGHPKVTFIESFGGRILLIRPGFKMEFDTIHEAQAYVKRQRWEINIEIIKGSSILRRMQRG